MTLTDYAPRHRADVTDAQLAEHEYSEGHNKYGGGKHEAKCYCNHVSRQQKDADYFVLEDGSHTYIVEDYGTPFYCTLFVPQP